VVSSSEKPSRLPPGWRRTAEGEVERIGDGSSSRLHGVGGIRGVSGLLCLVLALVAGGVQVYLAGDCELYVDDLPDEGAIASSVLVIAGVFLLARRPAIRVVGVVLGMLVGLIVFVIAVAYGMGECFEI
jgi:hypothetical protein